MMGLIRGTLKAYFIAVCIFAVLTLVLAALVRFTGFHEEWSLWGLVVVLSIAALLLGIMEGSIVGKRGLLVGLVSAAALALIILLIVRGVFAGMSEEFSFRVWYLIPVLAGAVGGILGTNSRKS